MNNYPYLNGVTDMMSIGDKLATMALNVGEILKRECGMSIVGDRKDLVKGTFMIDCTFNIEVMCTLDDKERIYNTLMVFTDPVFRNSYGVESRKISITQVKESKYSTEVNKSEMAINTWRKKYDGIECRFDGTPSKATIYTLEEKGFVFNRRLGTWFGYDEDIPYMYRLKKAG